MSDSAATSPSSDPAAAGLRVRRLVYGDLPAVLSIERRSFQTPWSLAMFVLELSKPSGICLAAVTTTAPPARGSSRANTPDGRLAGYLVCSRYADVWHLMNIAVVPERRREGIASTLIERLFEETGPGARITLEVRASNSTAIRMYERFGFRPAGHRRRYYHDNGEDALIMWLEPAGVEA